MNISTSPSDEALLRSAAAGDEEAFTALFRRRQEGIFRFALHMSGSIEMAEDATQEAFIALIRDPQSYNASKGPLVAYLYGIARNQLRRLIERDRSYVDLAEEHAAVLTDGADPLGELTRTEAVEGVREAVLQLPAPYREAVALCDLEEMSYSDAAAALDVPIGTVRSRLSRGRSMLIARLRAQRRRGEEGFNAMRCFA